MTDEQIRQKLKAFEGAKADLDEKTSQIVGRLLQDENEEQVSADSMTYKKLLKMTGYGVLVFLITTVTVLKYLDKYQQSLLQYWANSSPEEQLETFYDQMKTIICTSYVLLFLRVVRDFCMDMKKKHIGRNMHKKILRKVLQAPVNLFFDVTPIGKILSIFNGDLDVFYGEILNPLGNIFDMSAHILVVLASFFAIGNFSVTIGTFIFIIYLIRKVSKLFVSAGNQISKVGDTLWTPVRSYFHEALRGTTIIRAFNQE